MPRSLARLRYRPPPKAIVFPGLPRIDNGIPPRVERTVLKYVDRQSAPRNLRLQVVVNPKARRPTTGQFHAAPHKPFTLRDVVDPEGKARHGQIIYIFRNIRTNQIIYSLAELMNDHHLDQLPFIGKHSKPPVVRPDHWTPHCVLTFPTPEQGHSAYRRLRELRKMHETAWNLTDPEWKRKPIKERIRLIMNQVANTSADIAEVLNSQHARGEEMQRDLEKQQAASVKILDEKWAEINALASTAASKEKPADSVKWLEHQIRSLTNKLAMKCHQSEADQRRLKNAKVIQEIRLRKVQYALRKAGQLKTLQADLERTAAPAKEPGAEEKLQDLKGQASALSDAVTNPDPTRTHEHIAFDAKLLADLKAEIKTLEDAFLAQEQAKSRDNYITRSVLPPHLKKVLPKPFTLQGVNLRWADLQDALYAKGQWHDDLEHELLDANKMKDVVLLSIEDYEAERREESLGLLQRLGDQRLAKLGGNSGGEELTLPA